MRGVYRKVLMGLLTVFMVCVIVSTATTTVTAANGWGTLKAGDEMKWDNNIVGTITIKVQSVDGGVLTVDRTMEGATETFTIDANNLGGSDYERIATWIEPQSALSGQTQNYEFEGTSYKAYYDTYDSGWGDTNEIWYDFDTGILFEHRSTDEDGEVTTLNKLTSCNADLAEASGGGGGGCLGTLLIALVSVTTVVSYSVLRKKKK